VRLFGCDAPVVLRKVQDEDENAYTLVCEAFVHGPMGSQAVTLMEQGKLSKRNFVLH
jgi:hypothetical protein